ncbi:autophagy-related protein 16-1 isoform X2 [Neoarius graeffei]|uniref:autophagy-related protein 16-1 isoform X2 n=1 Tax=Neoarius graeffei TaxID=443677 RepID=UPI00298BF9E1|nr:autophagy-related protein 16-1 isoform X2 [Neoarius graeffei]
MEAWKSHVRAALIHRDYLQKDPFSGLFTKVSRLEEMLNLHMGVWEDLESDRTQSPNPNGVVQHPLEEKNAPKHYLQLKEEEQVRQKLAQKVSDLTSNLYLKEAELQYCHSQVSHYRNEAVLLGRKAICLKNDLFEYEYKLECQSKELATLQLEQRTLKGELALARQEKEELLERWLEEKREEAERMNKYNAVLERWQNYAGRLNRRLYSGPHRQTQPTTNSN